MSNFEISDTNRSSFCSYLERCLQHKNDEVKIVALNDIERRFSNELPTDTDSQSSFMSGTQQTNISIALINCLECEESRVATIAIRILSKLLIQVIGDELVKNHLDQVGNKSDLAKSRVCELSMKLMNDTFEDNKKVDFVAEKIIADLNSEDFSRKSPMIDFLTTLALTENGCNYMVATGILQNIVYKCADLHTPQSDSEKSLRDRYSNILINFGKTNKGGLPLM